MLNKRGERGSEDDITSPEHKLQRGDNSNMAASSPSSLPDETEAPSLQQMYTLLIEIQGTVKTLLNNNFKLTQDVAELKATIVKSDQEVKSLKEEFVNQSKYVATLEKELRSTRKLAKEQANDLQNLQVSLDNLEQYSRKSSLEFHGIPDNIEMPPDQIICKIAQEIGIQLEENDIEISHRIKRNKGEKPILARFVNYKKKAKLYKARVNLKGVTVQSLFPGAVLVTSAMERPNRIFINENLTPYRKEMMFRAVEKRRNEKIQSCWSLDGKIFIKTSPMGKPRQMHSVEEIKAL